MAGFVRKRKRPAPRVIPGTRYYARRQAMRTPVPGNPEFKTENGKYYWKTSFQRDWAEINAQNYNFDGSSFQQKLMAEGRRRWNEIAEEFVHPEIKQQLLEKHLRKKGLNIKEVSKLYEYDCLEGMLYRKIGKKFVEVHPAYAAPIVQTEVIKKAKEAAKKR